MQFEDDFGNRNQKDDRDFIPAIDEEGIEKNFEMISENEDKLGLIEINEELENAKSRREKRSSKFRSTPNIDDLFREPSATGVQMSEKVPSSNPNYVVPELRSFFEREKSGLASFM